MIGLTLLAAVIGAEPLSEPEQIYLAHITPHGIVPGVVYGDPVNPSRRGRMGGRSVQFNERDDARVCKVGRFEPLVNCYVRKVGEGSVLIAVPRGPLARATGEDRPTLALHGIDTGQVTSGFHAELTFEETFVRDGRERTWGGNVPRLVAVDRDKLNKIAAEAMEPLGYHLWTSTNGTQMWGKLIRPRDPVILELTDGERVEIEVKKFCEADRMRIHHRRWHFNKPVPSVGLEPVR